MMINTAISTAITRDLPATLDDVLEMADQFAKAEKAESTRANYRSWLQSFDRFAASKGVINPYPASPDLVRAFLVAEAGRGLAASSLSQAIAAIAYAHKMGGYDNPCDAEIVKATLRGIRRSLGVAPKRKAPATADRIKLMVSRIDRSTLRGKRDAALLLLGFGGAFRRSELVALQVSDVEEQEDGLRVVIRKSKTDQERAGQTIGIIRGTGTTCPVRALNDWLSSAEITDGPIFRNFARGGRVLPPRYCSRAKVDVGLTGLSVAKIVKRHAEAVGLDPDDFAGHSLRAGFCTSAAMNGASIFRLADVSRHKSMDVLRGYIREGSLFRKHAGEGLL